MTANDRISAYRRTTFRLAPGLQLKTVQDAIDFVNARGFVTLWPIQGIDIPSLWTAAAGDRPVAAEHDDPGHITWGWKDRMLDQRVWYYGKLIRGKATFVSLDLIPSFYALSNRVADLDDYVEAYHSGHLTREAKVIADALLSNGPQNTVNLRRLAHLQSKEAKSRFEKALTDLQRGLWILPCGVAEAGSWRYAFIYEILDRWLPEVPVRARTIRVSEARDQILESYMRSVGKADERQIGKVLGWKKDVLQACLRRMDERKAARQSGEQSWILTELDIPSGR
jgi:hypothetical protein